MVSISGLCRHFPCLAWDGLIVARNSGVVSHNVEPLAERAWLRAGVNKRIIFRLAEPSRIRNTVPDR